MLLFSVFVASSTVPPSPLGRPPICLRGLELVVSDTGLAFAAPRGGGHHYPPVRGWQAMG